MFVLKSFVKSWVMTQLHFYHPLNVAFPCTYVQWCHCCVLVQPLVKMYLCNKVFITHRSYMKVVHQNQIYWNSWLVASAIVSVIIEMSKCITLKIKPWKFLKRSLLILENLTCCLYFPREVSFLPAIFGLFPFNYQSDYSIYACNCSVANWWKPAYMNTTARFHYTIHSCIH